MLNGRERLTRILDFDPVDGSFVWFFGAWAATEDLWRTQGWDGRPVGDLLGFDTLLNIAPYYGPAPAFAYEVVAEDATTRTFVNHEGIVMREFKEQRDSSMPQFIKFPVENAADFERLAAERLALNRELRFPDTWRGSITAWRDSGWPRMCWADRWGGFFGPLRNLMGLENLCTAFHDEPKLVERMMAERADAIIAITDEVLQHTDFEIFWFWEDMAYNHASLIDPRQFRRFALPHYRRVCDWLRSRGIRHIGLDSDGNINELIPIWLDAGINALWPFEVQAGMDVLEVRRTYGRDLAIVGGIDKRTVARGGDAMRHAVDRVMPLVAQGGYVPLLDHSAPPDISWAQMCAFADYLFHRLGRG